MSWDKIPVRIRTVILYAPIGLLLLVLSPWTAWVLFTGLGVTGLLEWLKIVAQSREKFYTTNTRISVGALVLAMVAAIFSTALAFLVPIIAAVYVFWSDRSALRNDRVIGLVVVSYVAVLAYILRIEPNGLAYFGLVLVITVSSDSAAYFVGKAIGRHKFAPKISPNKTWEGAIGGWVFAIILAWIYVAYFVPTVANWPWFAKIVFFWALAFAGQMGDLGESALKRKYNVKDSGTIFPGHGGVLDRFDSFAAVIALMSLVLLVVQ